MKRFGLSSVAVLLLSVLVTVVATADFSGNGTLGTGGTGGTGPIRGLGRDLTAVKPLPEPVSELVPAETGGKVSLSDGSLELDIPANLSVDAPLEISIEPQRAPGGSGVSIFQQWDLRAYKVGRAEEVTRFSKEITLTSVFSPDDIPGADWNSLTFVWYDPEQEAWIPLATEVDFESRTMTATTDHFSIYGSQASSAYSLPGQVMNYQVNLNSGAASYSYPIQLPPGRGGFQPLNLSFNYNSGSVDGMKNERDTGSWAGIGWSFDIPHIFYNEETEEYSVVIGGISGTLKHPGSGDRWFTIPDQGIYAKQVSGGWEVKTTDGTLYTFGSTAATRRVRWTNPCTEQVTYRFDLESVVDVHGNTIEVDWDEPHEYDYTGCRDTRAMYPEAIKAMDGVSVLWKAVFEYFDPPNVTYYKQSDYTDPATTNRAYVRNDVPLGSGSLTEPIITELRVLKAIDVEDDSANTIRKYELAFTTTTPTGTVAGTHELDSITLKGKDGGSLPATSFDYGTPREVYFKDTSASPANTFSHDWPYLTTIENGYGASIVFTYTQTPASGTEDVWTRQLVTKVTADPDPDTDTDGVPIVVEYEYLNGSGLPGVPEYVYATNTWLSDYRGVREVKVTSSDGSYTTTRFFTVGEDFSVYNPDPDVESTVEEDAEKFKGRSYLVETYDQGGNKLTAQSTDWDWEWEDSFFGIYRAFVAGSGIRIFNSSGTEVSKSWTYFEYDDYGNVIEERRLGDDAITTDDVTIHRDFILDTDWTEWIVNTVKNERIYAGDFDTDPDDSPDSTVEPKIGETRYSYDGQSYGTAPSKGDVTEGETFTSSSDSQSVTYDHDDYGNIEWMDDPYGERTEFTYDDLLHARLIKTKLPAVGQASSMDVEVLYDTDLDILRGLKSTDRDENDVDTDYEYDQYGRITSVIRPGDTSTHPTMKFDYQSWGTAGQQRVEIEAKIDELSTPTYLMRQEYFDGFGRVVQVHEPSETANKKLALSTVRYDGSGGVAAQYTPWEISDTLNAYQSPISTGTASDTTKSPTVAASLGDGDFAWTNTGNVFGLDNIRATATGVGTTARDTGWRQADRSDLRQLRSNVIYQDEHGAETDLIGTNGTQGPYDIFFNQPLVPSDSSINGISAQLVRKRPTTGLVKDYDIKLSQDGTLSNDASVGSTWNTTYGTASYGGSTNLWGLSWAPADINAGDNKFSLRVTVENTSSTEWSHGIIDVAEIKIHYDDLSESEYLTASGFGFDIPLGSKIEGIVVNVDRSAETATKDIHDAVVQLLRQGDRVGDNKADTVNKWPTTEAVTPYGGSTDTWGREWTAAEINSSEFGVALRVRTESLDDAQVDHVEVKVYYKAPISGVYSGGSLTDALGRTIEQTGIDGSVVTRSYVTATASGEVWKETVTDPEGNKVENYTDAFGRLVRIVEFDDTTPDPDEYRETRYTYDRLGNLIRVEVDPEEAGPDTVVTEMTYDWLGRKLTHRDPDVGFWQYAYDDNGNLKTQTDARGVEITFTYDELNRETRRECTANCPGATAPVILAEFYYDDTTDDNNGKGRRTSAFNGDDDGVIGTDDTGTHTVYDSYYYDDRGRLTQQTRTLQGTEYITSYAYDPVDRLLTTTLPNGEVVTQDYDSRNLPESVFSSAIGDVVSESTYNILDLPTQVKLGNGTENNREYFTLDHQTTSTENFGQLYRIESTDGTTDFVDLTFDWDLNGNLTSRDDNVPADGPDEETFTYDFLNRLKSADVPVPSSGGTAAPAADHAYPFESITSDVVEDVAGSSDGTGEPAAPNGPTVATGYVDNGFTFDGSDRVELPNTVLDGLSAVTVATWFKTSASGIQTIISGANSGDSSEFLLRITTSTQLQLRIGSSQHSWSSLPTLNDGEWHHVALSFDDANDELVLYLDGTSWGSITTTEGALDVDASGLYIGQNQSSVGSGFSEGFDGTMDEFQVFGSVLDDYEVALAAGLGDPFAHWELDETSDTTAADSEGSLDGTLTNGPTWTTSGKHEGALVFDGTNDYVDVPHTALDGAKSASVSLWFKTTGTGDQAIVSGAKSGNSNEFLMWFRSGTQFDFNNNWQTASWTGLTSIADDTWHHLVLVKDGPNTDAILYIDGVSQGTKNLGSSALIDLDSGGLVIGQEQDSVGGGFDSSQDFAGTLDDIRIFRRAINADEVSDIYNGSGGTSNELFNYSYDGHDNITSKRGQGTYTYDVDAGTAPDESDPGIDLTSGGTDHYWTFNDEDISGTNVNNLLSSQDITLGGSSASPAVVAGLFGDALDFDGVDDYFTFPGSTVHLYTDLTLSFWLKDADNVTLDATLFRAIGTSTFEGYLGSSTEISFTPDGGSTTTEWDNFGDLDDGEWHNVVLVRDDSNDLVELFVDGVSYGSNPATMDNINANNNIVTGDYYDGLMDDFRIYERVLTAGEITDLYYTATVPSRPHLVTGTTTSGADAYAYDANGNTTERPGQDLVWNAENLLEAVEDSSSSNTIESYIYDADGQRAIKISASGTVTHYVSGQFQAEPELDVTRFISSQNAQQRLGQANAVYGKTMVGGAIGDNTNGTDAGAVFLYELTIASWTETKITASDGAAGDSFGWDVAIYGDTLVVGAPYDDDNGSNSGSVYIYTRTNGAWGNETKLKPSDGAAGDNFGFSVSLSGDTLAVGAKLDDGVATDAGSVYVFTWSGSAWGSETNLQPSALGTSDEFGYSVSVDEVSGILVAGAPLHNNSSLADSGKAWVYSGSGSSWTEDAAIAPSSGVEAGENFGWSVATDGGWVMVGGPRDTDIGTNAGALYAFSDEGSGWTQQQKIIGNDVAASDLFAYSVAIDGDRAVTSGYGHDGASTNIGVTYVLRLDGGEWLIGPSREAKEPAYIDSYGYDVSINGNWVVAGSHQDDGNYDNVGSLRLQTINNSATTTYFHGGQVAASTTAKRVDPDSTPDVTRAETPTADDRLGTAVAIDGNIVVVTAPRDDDAASDAGAAHVYEIDPDTGDLTFVQVITASNAAASDGFGNDNRSVAMDNGTIAVGAYLADKSGGPSNTGAVYVFTYDEGEEQWEEEAILVASDAAANDWFGLSVDIDGDRIVVGSQNDDSATHNDSGSIYIFTRTNGTWDSGVKIAAPTSQGTIHFGSSVAIEGDYVVAGARRWDQYVYDEGVVYTFKFDGTNWNYFDGFLAPTPITSAQFGTAVDISGRTIVVGSVFEDSPVTNAGTVYVYELNAAGDEWIHQQKITHSGVGVHSYSGWSIKIDRDLFIVSSIGDDDAVNDAGAAYLYGRNSSGTWVEIEKFQHDSATAGDEFGTSVGIDGEYAVIGVSRIHDGGTADAGGFSLVQVREQSVQFLHPDHLGSPVAATDLFGDVVGTQNFYPFGEVRASSGVFDTERGFTGQIFDGGTGLGFYNARYYDAALGRFISPDSIVPNPLEPKDRNRFVYVRNSPLVLIDITGHDPLCPTTDCHAVSNDEASNRAGSFSTRTETVNVNSSGGCGATVCPQYLPPPPPYDERVERELFLEINNPERPDGSRLFDTDKDTIRIKVNLLNGGCERAEQCVSGGSGRSFSSPWSPDIELQLKHSDSAGVIAHEVFHEIEQQNFPVPQVTWLVAYIWEETLFPDEEGRGRYERRANEVQTLVNNGSLSEEIQITFVIVEYQYE